VTVEDKIEKIKQALLDGDGVSYGSWYFTLSSMCCGEPGCCSDYWEPDIEEAMARVCSYCDGNWEKVRVDED
jgi:hypothetical protein